MYDNVKYLRLVPEGNHTFVTAMISSEGEVLEFRHHRKYTTLHRVASHHAAVPASPSPITTSTIAQSLRTDCQF